MRALIGSKQMTKQWNDLPTVILIFPFKLLVIIQSWCFGARVLRCRLFWGWRAAQRVQSPPARMCVNSSRSHTRTRADAHLAPGCARRCIFAPRLICTSGNGTRAKNLLRGAKVSIEFRTPSVGRSTMQMQILFVCSFDSCSFHSTIRFVALVKKSKVVTDCAERKMRRKKKIGCRPCKSCVFCTRNGSYKYLQPALILWQMDFDSKLEMELYFYGNSFHFLWILLHKVEIPRYKSLRQWQWNQSFSIHKSYISLFFATSVPITVLSFADAEMELYRLETRFTFYSLTYNELGHTFFNLDFCERILGHGLFCEDK